MLRHMAWMWQSECSRCTGLTHKTGEIVNRRFGRDELIGFLAQRAIWTAVQQPEMQTVAAKTEDRQAMLRLHRMRALLVKFRTMQVNQLRGLLYEFGATFRAGVWPGCPRSGPAWQSWRIRCRRR